MGLQLLATPAVSRWTWIGTALFVLVVLGMLGAVALINRRWGGAAEGEDAARTVARNTSLPFVLQLFTRAIDLGFVAVLYRFVTDDAMGGYELAGLVVVQYLGTIADWGLTVLMTRDIARDPARAGDYFRTTLRLRLRFAWLALPAAALFALGYNGLAALGVTRVALPGSTLLLIAILALTLFPAAFSSTVTALFQARERAAVPAAINVQTNVLSALARVAALSLGFGALGVAVGALLGALAGAALFARALRRQAPEIGWAGPQLAMKPLIVQGWPLLLNSLLIGVFFRFDSLIIAAYSGQAAAADYGTAYKFISLTQIIPPVVVNALFPLLSRRAAGDREGLRRAYEGTLRLLLLAALPIAAAMTVLARPLVAVLAGEQYLPDGALALAITIWYLPWSFVNGLTQYVVIALDRQRSITLAFGVTAMFNLSMNLLLVPRYGFAAAAAVTIASELVLLWPLRRVVAGEIGAPPLLRLVWRPALAAAAMGAVLWGTQSLPPQSWGGQLLTLGLAALIGPLVYGWALLALKTFTDDDYQLVRRALRRRDGQTATAQE
ncbi:MAG TPA: oligosaccharide flippase family protein [Herpetosiphonaceae bacterium]